VPLTGWGEGREKKNPQPPRWDPLKTRTKREGLVGRKGEEKNIPLPLLLKRSCLGPPKKTKTIPKTTQQSKKKDIFLGGALGGGRKRPHLKKGVTQ